MNKIYNIVWNSSTNQWTVASELAKAQGSAHSQSISKLSNPITSNQTNITHKLNRVAASVSLAVIATLGSSFIATQAMAAECSGVVNSYANGSSGTACTVSGTSYDYVHASNGTPVTVNNPVTIYATASGTAAVLVSTNASMHFMGNTKIGAVGQRHGVDISQGSIVIDGNLDASAVGLNGRAVYVEGAGSSLTVNGNFTGTRTGSVQGAVAQITAGNTINVTGTTMLNGNGVDGMRLAGTATLGSDVSITVCKSHSKIEPDDGVK